MQPLPLNASQPLPWVKVEDPTIARHRELKGLIRDALKQQQQNSQEIETLKEKNEMQKQRLNESLEKKKTAEANAQICEEQIHTYKQHLNSKDRVKKRKGPSLSSTRSQIDVLHQKKKKLLASQHCADQQFSERFGFLAQLSAKDSGDWKVKILQELKDRMKMDLSHTLKDEIAQWKDTLLQVQVNGMRWQSFRLLFPKAQNRKGAKISSFLIEDMPDPSTLDTFKVRLDADSVKKLFNETPALTKKNGHRFVISELRVVYNSANEVLQLEPKVELKQK